MVYNKLKEYVRIYNVHQVVGISWFISQLNECDDEKRLLQIVPTWNIASANWLH